MSETLNIFLFREIYAHVILRTNFIYIFPVLKQITGFQLGVI
jgi:hypothetical protein